MFGYVVINKPDLLIRDFDEYRAFYCGLCRELHEKYGIKGQLTLNYDLTFLSILLSALYEGDTSKSMIKCVAHPFSSHPSLRNEFTSYAADMNILLSYYKFLDDWKDDHSIKGKIGSDILKKAGEKVRQQYPDKALAIEEELNKLNEYEKNNVSDIDLVSGCFGRLMSVLFAYRQDEWTHYLEQMGFYLGKFIYILDAYDDYEEDISKGRYNALSAIGHNENIIKEMLTMMMAECSSAFEMLPIIQEHDILANIIYSGVWVGFKSGHSMKSGELFTNS